MPSIERVAERRVGAPLRDPEAELTGGPRRVDLPLRPELRAPDGLLVLAQRDVRRRADVEAHGDVRSEPALDLGDALGREALLAPVVDRAERDAVVVDPRERVAQREHLEAAGVGQDRAVPAAERVQAAELLDHVLAGAEVQVVRVPEDHVGAERAHLGREEGLHRPLGADRHERGRTDVAVRRAEHSGARGTVRGLDDEAHRAMITGRASRRRRSRSGNARGWRPRTAPSSARPPRTPSRARAESSAAGGSS